MKRISESQLDDLVTKARNSERARANYNLHERLDDKVQRFFNAMEPGTYVQPHRHTGEDKWELFIILRGSVCALVFNNQGQIMSRTLLQPGKNICLEIGTNTWHTLVSMESGSIVYESKRGPYEKTTAKDFASWAPPEKHPACNQFLDWFIHGEPGSFPPELN